MERLEATVSWPPRREEIEKAAEYVPDDFVQDVTASGTPEDARAAVARYVEHGCTHPVLYPLGDARLVIDTFASAGRDRAEVA